MNRDLALVALSLTTWGIGEGMFLFFEPLYLQQLGADPIQIGAILSFVGMAMTIAHLPAGYLADRFGRRPLLHAAWILGTLAVVLMALSRSLTGFVIAIILYGLTSFVAGPLNGYVTAARGRRSVGRAITLILSSFSIGAILGPLLGGWIGQNFGLHRTFSFTAVLFFLSTLMIFFIRPQPVETMPEFQQSSRWRSLFTPRYIQFLAVIFVAMFFRFLPQPLSQNFLQNVRGVDLFQMGQLISARGVGVVLLNLILGQFNARRGFLFAQVVMAAFTLLILKGSGLPSYLLAYFFLGSYQTARSLASAQGRALVHAANMGIAYGAIETAASLAIILAPPLAGWLYSRMPSLIYSTSLVLILVGFLLTLAFLPLRVDEVI
jgi:predicted MFS family arabinose efflux permease